MSEQVSAKHGPAEDDHIKRQDRTEIQEHGEEWPDLQDIDVWPDNGIWAPESRLVAGPAGPDFRAIELRSELARHLDRATFPATREELTRVLTDRQAEPRLLGVVSALPPGLTVSSVGEVIRTAGLQVEEHRT